MFVQTASIVLLGDACRVMSVTLILQVLIMLQATYYWEPKGPETQACASNGMAPDARIPTVALGVWGIQPPPALTDVVS